MSRRVSLCSVILGVALVASVVAPQAHAASYNIDGTHSAVIFKVSHLGASNSYGRFNDVSGSFNFNPDAPGDSSIEITIKADSVDTHNERRDTHLRSPDFFNAKQFPVITLKSKSIKKKGDDYEVTGELNLHGVKKDITVTARHIGTGRDRSGNAVAGFEATFTVKRSDFGMKYGLEGIGDDVTVTVAVEGVQQ